MIELPHLFLSRRKIAAADRPSLPHLVEHPRNVCGLTLQKLLETVGTHPVSVHSITQERPGLNRNDRCLVRPVLGKLSPPVDQVVQQRNLVRPEREKRTWYCAVQER